MTSSAPAYTLMSAAGKLLSLAALVLALAACEAITRPVEPLPTPSPEAERLARQLLEQGRYREAAAEFLRLASAQRAPAADELRLRAASAYLQAGDAAAANALVSGLRTRDLPLPLAQYRQVLLGRLALGENRPEETLRLLPRIPADLPQDLAAEVHQLRAEAYAQTGNYLEEARERVERGRLLTDPAQRTANEHAIWQALSPLTEPALTSAALPAPDTFGGWIELAALAKRQLAEPQALAAAIERWQARYPDHPADAAIVPELLRRSRLEVARPRHVALLLPFGGSFANAGETVRDGFLAAWYSAPDAAERPVITVYDTTVADISTVYAQAVAAGADLVVGPLRRSAVNELAQARQLPVRTLALNFAQSPETSSVTSTLDHTSSGEPGASEHDSSEVAVTEPAATVTDGLYQFALSPEMEARAVAEQAWLAGFVTAAVLAPEGPWGERVATAFAGAWSELGGMVVERQFYAEDSSAMASAVKTLLNVDEAEQRGRALQAYLRRQLEYQARPRTDLDFIFMAAFPTAARQLRPQLKFFGASGIPVYATSHIFAGSPNRGADQDVNGVVFGDMPWVLSSHLPDPNLREQIERLWPKSMRDYKRLFAFGVDAYNVIFVLPQLRADRFAVFHGGTGRLSIDEYNRLRRQLTWARFDNGVPIVVERATAAP